MVAFTTQYCWRSCWTMGSQLMFTFAVVWFSWLLADREVWLWPVWRMLQWEFTLGITGLAVACLPQHAPSPTWSSPSSSSLHPTQPFLLRLKQDASCDASITPPVPWEATALDSIGGASTEVSSRKTVLRPCLGKSTFLLAVYTR